MGLKYIFTRIIHEFWFKFKKIIFYYFCTKITLPGKLVGAGCAISGLLILAMPISIISSNFSNTITRKKNGEYLLKSKVFRV